MTFSNAMLHDYKIDVAPNRPLTEPERTYIEDRIRTEWTDISPEDYANWQVIFAGEQAVQRQRLAAAMAPVPPLPPCECAPVNFDNSAHVTNQPLFCRTPLEHGMPLSCDEVRAERQRCSGRARRALAYKDLQCYVCAPVEPRVSGRQPIHDGSVISCGAKKTERMLGDVTSERTKQA